jgi:hypothetical protein
VVPTLGTPMPGVATRSHSSVGAVPDKRAEGPCDYMESEGEEADVQVLQSRSMDSLDQSPGDTRYCLTIRVS